MIHSTILMNKALKITLITLFWLVIWWVLSLIVGTSLLLPSPITVAVHLFDLFKTSYFWLSLLMSLLRVIIGIILGIIFGFALALLCYRIKLIYDVLNPLMTVIKATPVASFIILVVLFMGKNTVPSFISILMVLPVVWTNVYEGLKNINPELKEVCNVYKFSYKKRLRALYIPSILPYFTSSILSSIGLGWKAGIAAEILYPPLKSIGKAIVDSKQFLLTEDLFAWTFVVILLSLTFEALIKLTINFASKRQNGGRNENN